MFLKTTSPLWMGIVNLAPDSFSDGGHYNTTEKAIEKSLELVHKGADIIDFGGVSTNPKIKSLLISPAEELERIYNTLKEARKILPKNILISIDTFSPIVAYTLAKDKLIDIINDIYSAQKEEILDDVCCSPEEMRNEAGGTQEKVRLGQNHQEQRLVLNTAKIAAEFNLGLILMHMPSPLHIISGNKSCIDNIIKFFVERIDFCKKVGVRNLAIDPGIGYGIFGKSFENILEILTTDSIHKLCQLEVPLLIGVSRKAFHLDIDANLKEPLSRDKLSKEIELKCIADGVNIIRTHNL